MGLPVVATAVGQSARPPGSLRVNAASRQSRLTCVRPRIDNDRGMRRASRRPFRERHGPRFWNFRCTRSVQPHSGAVVKDDAQLIDEALAGDRRHLASYCMKYQGLVVQYAGARRRHVRGSLRRRARRNGPGLCQAGDLPTHEQLLYLALSDRLQPGGQPPSARKTDPLARSGARRIGRRTGRQRLRCRCPGPSNKSGSQVQAALATLSEEHRAILVLREIDDCAYDAIAEILDLPVGTIRSRLHRARLQLRDQLKVFFRKTKMSSKRRNRSTDPMNPHRTKNESVPISTASFRRTSARRSKNRSRKIPNCGSSATSCAPCEPACRPCRAMRCPTTWPRWSCGRPNAACWPAPRQLPSRSVRSPAGGHGARAGVDCLAGGHRSHGPADGPARSAKRNIIERLRIAQTAPMPNRISALPAGVNTTGSRRRPPVPPRLRGRTG